MIEYSTQNSNNEAKLRFLRILAKPKILNLFNGDIGFKILTLIFEQCLKLLKSNIKMMQIDNMCNM